MKKNSKFWRGFLVAGIAALAVPSFVQGQSTGSGAAGSSSGMTAGSSGSTSNMPGSSGTRSGSPGTSGMTGSAGMNDTTSSMSGMNKDMGGTSADQQLNSQIRQSLNADTTLAGVGRNVQLNTQNGQVTLQGSVSSEAEKNQVEQKVKQMNNVESVRNQLRVTSMGGSSSMGSSSSMRSPSGSSPSTSSPSTTSPSTSSPSMGSSSSSR